MAEFDLQLLPSIPVVCPQIGRRPLCNVVAEAVVGKIGLQHAAGLDGHFQLLQAGYQVSRVVAALGITSSDLPRKSIQHPDLRPAKCTS